MAERGRGISDRRVGRAARRHALRGPCWAHAAAAGEVPRSIRAHRGGKAADVCPGPRARVLRSARGPIDRARCGARGLPHVLAHRRCRAQHPVPDEEGERSVIITKKALHRRTFLRGLGTTLALPLLDGMVPALSALGNTAAKPPVRLGFVYVPNGIIGSGLASARPNHWTPAAEGA